MRSTTMMAVLSILLLTTTPTLVRRKRLASWDSTIARVASSVFASCTNPYLFYSVALAGRLRLRQIGIPTRLFPFNVTDTMQLLQLASHLLKPQMEELFFK